MVEYKLEELIQEAKYVDPTIYQRLTNRVVGASDTRAIEKIWEFCISSFTEGALGDFLRGIGNDHLKEDFEWLKPTTLTSMYYLAADYLFRSYIDEKEKEHSTGIIGANKGKLEKAFNSISDLDRSKEYEIDIPDEEIVPCEENKFNIHGRKTTPFLENILGTDVRFVNPFFYSKKPNAYMPEITGFFEKIYDFNLQDIYKLEVDEVRKISSGEMSPEEYQQKKAEQLLQAKANIKWENAKNLYLPLTVMLCESTQYLSGHQDRKSGCINIKGLRELYRIIDERMKLPPLTDCYKVPDSAGKIIKYGEYEKMIYKSRDYRDERTAKEWLDMNERVIKWAAEDLFGLGRLDDALSKFFEAARNVGITAQAKRGEKRNAKAVTENIQKKLAILAGMRLRMPGKTLPKSYEEDFQRISDEIVKKNPTVEWVGPALRILSLTGLILPNIVRAVAICLFARKTKDGEFEIKKREEIYDITDQIRRATHWIDDEERKVRTIDDEQIFERGTSRKRGKTEEETFQIRKEMGIVLKFEEIHQIIMDQKLRWRYYDEVDLLKTLTDKRQIKDDTGIIHPLGLMVLTFCGMKEELFPE